MHIENDSIVWHTRLCHWLEGAARSSRSVLQASEQENHLENTKMHQHRFI